MFVTKSRANYALGEREMALSFTEILIPAANLGECNPTVDIHNVSYIHASFALSSEAQKNKPEYFGEGMVSTMLPYLQQDNYDRDRRLRAFKVAVLENENLKATVLTELGGRLYSLYDKKAGKEILYTNPVFQPANLSLRNAWFSGGVEWNVSIKGHNPLTCSPLFVAKVKANGEEGLRVYEYERKRKIVYSIDFFLPKNSETLLVIPKIENTEDEQKFCYWWSNIAVPEEEKTRVIVPASKAFVSSYDKNRYFVDYLSVPTIDGRDTSYPSNARCSNDFFYDIPKDEEKWIASVDGNGEGLIQVSTSFLKGRKMFIWGRGEGGKNWQRFLTDEKTGGYVEIQAGLTHTQMQHLPLLPRTTWSWIEAYGKVSVGSSAHGEYDEAVRKTKSELQKMFPGGIEKTLETLKDAYGNAKIVQIMQYGSGWGALENELNALCGKDKISSDCPFDEGSLGEEQAPFYALIKNGFMQERDEKKAIKGYGSGETLKKLLEKSLQREEGDNWFSRYHLGVVCFGLEQEDEAREHWEKSLERKPNGWAMRNLAMLDKKDGKRERAVEQMLKAVELMPHFSLYKDCAMMLIWAEEYERCINLVDSAPVEMLANGRLLYYKAYCLHKVGKNAEASEIINQDFIMSDIKEGELSISELWYRVYGELLFGNENITEEEKIKGVDEKMPLGKLDFRMH